MQSRQRRPAKIFRDEDWAAEGKWHASKLKPPAAATLISLAQTTALQVSPLRTSKQSHAAFRLLSPCSVKPGDVWQTAGHRCKVLSQTGQYATLDSNFKAGMMVKTVNHLTWSMQPEFVAEQMTSFWKQYWDNPKEPDMDCVIKKLDHLPKLEPCDPNISSSELFSAQNAQGERM